METPVRRGGGKLANVCRRIAEPSTNGDAEQQP
jgi:hypothetical protein